MNKRVKSVVAVVLATVVTVTGISINNISKTKADEASKKYERATHLALNSNADLEITRNELGNTPMGKEDSWTIFMYICGSDLESCGGAATKDIEEILEATYSENVNFVIQTGGACEWQKYDIDPNKIQRYVAKEDTIELVESLPNASMAKAATLEDFISWGVKNYASEHMGVIYWNHGGGSIYGACSDENYDGMLTLSEFEMAMYNATKDMTDKFEFIGFDACLMATVEAANTFVPFADYMIASEESESSEGWNYTAIANLLAENSDTDVITLGKTIIDSFMDKNIQNGTDNIATLSMTDLSKIDNILVEFNKVAKKMDEMSNTKEEITIFTRLAYAAENYSEGYGFDMIDFTDYMLNIVDLIPEAEQVANLMEEAIVYERHGDRFLDTKGLSFYYCYGNINMSNMNILRNITISPYLLNFIEKLAYGSLNNSSLDGFVSNNWHMNFYYNDENYDFVKYEFEEVLDYSEVLSNDEYFANASFDDIWYGWFEGDSCIDSDEIEDVEEEELGSETIEIDINIGDGVTLHGATLTTDVSLDELKNVARAEYKLVVDNGTNMNVLGSLGSIEENVTYTGKWFALSDGSLIVADKINEGNGLTMYRANVLLDGDESFIYFVADKKQNVLVLGTSKGIDDEKMCASRIESELKQNSKIAPIYTSIDYTTGNVTKTYGNENIVSGKVIQAVALDSNSFVVETTDAFGKKACSTPIK